MNALEPTAIPADVLRRLSAPAPRYTSYPTAVQFSPKVQPATYAGWLAALPPGASLSLYAHIPFCTELCWYCACATKATRQYEPISQYLPALLREIEAVGLLPPRDAHVSAMHWGGGSPSVLKPDDIGRLAGAFRAAFHFGEGAEFAVEVDPRGVSDEQVQAFAKAGLTRVSLGVQDFEPEVQVAINRVQSYETTADVVERFREAGVGSLNIDLVYGLPRQTVASLERTMDKVGALRPDRIAVFGYAHVPERAKHQKLMDAATMPGLRERFDQRQRIADLLVGFGYREIGLDHYALPGDTLATSAIKRNFQGYTTDRADATLGFGATAISQFPGGYAQNVAPTHQYIEAVGERGLATARGVMLTDDDQMRAAVIERLMCGLDFSSADLRARFGAAAEPIVALAGEVLREDRDGLTEPTADGFRCTELGKIFVRVICAKFDAYWAGSARHALAV